MDRIGRGGFTMKRMILRSRMTCEGEVDDDEDEEGDGMSDASRNWAKDGVGLLHWGQRHLGAIHDSCN